MTTIFDQGKKTLLRFQKERYLGDDENPTGIEWHLCEPFLSQLIRLSDWIYITASTNHPSDPFGQAMFLQGWIRPHHLGDTFLTFLRQHDYSYTIGAQWHVPDKDLGKIRFCHDMEAQKWWLLADVPTPAHGRIPAKQFKDLMIRTGYTGVTDFPSEFYDSSFFVERYISFFSDPASVGGYDDPPPDESLVPIMISNDADPKDRDLYLTLLSFFI